MEEEDKVKKGARYLGETILSVLQLYGVVKDGKKEYLDYHLTTAEPGVYRIVYTLIINGKPLGVMHVYVGGMKIIRVFPVLYALDRHLCQKLSFIANALDFSYYEVEESDCGQLRRALSGGHDDEKILIY